MSSRGELYILEDVIPKIEEEITAQFGKNWDVNIPKSWTSLTDDKNFPDEGEAFIENEDGEIIGKITWRNRFLIEKYEGSRFIVAEPENIKLYALSDGKFQIVAIKHETYEFKHNFYHLNGIMVATDWYGNKGFAKINIETDDKGLEEIKKDPLQDYLGFGVQSVDYVWLTVTKIESVRREKPLGTITRGEANLTENEIQALENAEEINVRW